MVFHGRDKACCPGAGQEGREDVASRRMVVHGTVNQSGGEAGHVGHTSPALNQSAKCVLVAGQASCDLSSVGWKPSVFIGVGVGRTDDAEYDEGGRDP